MGGGSFHFALLMALLLLLVSAGIQDIRTREIANWKNIAIAALAPAWWWASDYMLWPDVAAQLAMAFVIFALFCGAFAAGWMGGGDVKMIGALALWLPFQALAGMLIGMSLIGGALTLLLLIERTMRRKTAQIEVPYGVAIALSALFALREPLLNQFR